MKTLPDILEPRLSVISIGLNPSLLSAERGFYFANPRNRFWKAMQAGSLLPAHIEPGVAAQRWLLENSRIGFTDLVKRPTRGSSELRAKDYAAAVPELLEKLLRYEPEVIWFHGKLVYGRFLRYSGLSCDTSGDWGLQPLTIGTSRVFMTPNPSPANAAYSLSNLASWYEKLGVLISSQS